MDGLGSEHTDPFGLTGAKKTFNGCEGFHSEFQASLCGKKAFYHARRL